jgi:sortase (surface protein transpeptidase)
VVPDLSIGAPIRPVGVRGDGAVDVPEDGDEVGWYRFGTPPGSASGSAVLVGHRDTRAEGPGLLYPIGDLEPGSQIDVVLDDWTTVVYRVVSRESFVKQVLPTDELFREDGDPVLTIITCGGPFTPGEGYRDNVVVTAVPDGVRTPATSTAV